MIYLFLYLYIYVRGCPFFFLPTPHVKLYNFDPHDRGGGYLTPSPPPNAIQNFMKNQIQGTVDSCLPPVIYKIEHWGRYRAVPLLL